VPAGLCSYQHTSQPWYCATGFSPPGQGPCFAVILQLWPVMAWSALGMRQPAHGCNVRAKRLAHRLLTNSRRLQPGWRSQRLTCGKRVPFALLTRADQGGTQPRLAGACQSHRQKRFTRREGGSDATWPLVSLLLHECFSRLSVCSACICERTNSPRGTTLIA
jgi:hypothetical protein